jgi:hypothetical protein
MKKQSRNRHRLALTKESLRQLTTTEVAAPVGGVITGNSNPECTRTCMSCDVGTITGTT